MAVAPPRTRRPTAQHRAAVGAACGDPRRRAAPRPARQPGGLGGARRCQRDPRARGAERARRRRASSRTARGAGTSSPSSRSPISRRCTRCARCSRPRRCDAACPGRRRRTSALVAAARACRAAARAGDLAARLEANRRFHDLLYALAGQPAAVAPDRPALGLDRGIPRALLRPPRRGGGGRPARTTRSWSRSPQATSRRPSPCRTSTASERCARLRRPAAAA